MIFQNHHTYNIEIIAINANVLKISWDIFLGYNIGFLINYVFVPFN